jgi:plasmid maintenance system antidote protein VapI
MNTKQLLKVELAQAKPLELLPSVLLDQTKDAKEAIKLMVSMSGATHEGLADEMHKPRETLTRFVNGNGGLDINSLVKLINACGNAYLVQYLAHQYGFELKAIDQKAQRKAELLAELQLLENAA